MAKSKTKDSNSKSKHNMRPALSPENEENQLISLATNLAKQRLLDGTASNQLICQCLSLGTTKSRLEKEKLEEENKLLKAKTEAIQSQKSIDESYKKVIMALKEYSGNASYDDDYEY